MSGSRGNYRLTTPVSSCPEDERLDLFNEEDESEEDEASVISRDVLKRQSQLIIDANSKKKTWKKKKGKM
ncbi:hypothetical protein E3U43_008600 [Larimichthys crocea]|uniref:Uncharacterized protein n=1 Tax=Larimichthys crocea TaxID=215358 RepID=A0ACD3RUY8_LARCR|nr:hypothetical protein E3U43_008600 [Larimichthys crocea]